MRVQAEALKGEIKETATTRRKKHQFKFSDKDKKGNFMVIIASIGTKQL